MSKNKALKNAIANKQVEKSAPVKTRQVLIETDGTNIRVLKDETAGALELMAVLQSLIQYLGAPKK